MRALIAVAWHGGTPITLAYDREHAETWEREIDAHGSSPNDFGMDPPEEAGIYVWEGRIAAADFDGTCRKATADEIARVQAGESVWPTAEETGLRILAGGGRR